MDAARLKNGALTAWIKTVPSEVSLDAYLATIPSEVRSTVESSVRSAYEFADAFLDTTASKGAVDISEFHQKLDVELRSRFYWMDEAGLAALRSFTGWYAWHEGYLAT